MGGWVRVRVIGYPRKEESTSRDNTKKRRRNEITFLCRKEKPEGRSRIRETGAAEISAAITPYTTKTYTILLLSIIFLLGITNSEHRKPHFQAKNGYHLPKYSRLLLPRSPLRL